MPLRIRWSSKEYMGIALMLLGGCGGVQLLFIAIAQYILSIGNFIVLILIPIFHLKPRFFTDFRGQRINSFCHNTLLIKKWRDDEVFIMIKITQEVGGVLQKPCDIDDAVRNRGSTNS